MHSPQQPWWYRAYGLTIRSDLELPELLLGAAGTPDVSIRRGTAPAALEGTTARGACFALAPRQALLEVESIGRFLVCDGKEILVQATAGTDPSAVRVILLGSALGALCHQRSAIALTGGAFAHRDGAVLVLGPSASGTSTLVAEFWRRGCGVISDGLSVVGEEDGALFAYPGYPEVKLWPDSLARLGLDAALAHDRAGTTRCRLPVHGAFEQRPLPVRNVLTMEVCNSPRPSLSRLHGSSAIRALVGLTYRCTLQESGERAGHFLACVRIASTIPVWRLGRPERGFDLDILAQMVEMGAEA